MNKSALFPRWHQGFNTFYVFIIILSVKAQNNDINTSVHVIITIILLLWQVKFGFINIINVSPQRAHQYLVTEGQSSSDLRLFKNQRHLIWFHLYHRQRNTG